MILSAWPAARLRLPVTVIWILATPISSDGLSISNVTLDIEDFDIECSFDIDVSHLRYGMSISKVFDIEGLIIRYRRSQTFDIEGHAQGCRYRDFMPSMSNIKRSISHVDIVYDIEGFLTFDIEGHFITYQVRYRIRYSIHPMSFTVERKHPASRLCQRVYGKTGFFSRNTGFLSKLFFFGLRFRV
jgi:hypothetical protein